MKNLINDNDKICWQPSAGIDFKSIFNWERNLGNEIQPTFFMHTDIGYSIDVVNQTIYFGEDDLLHYINDEYLVEYFQCELFNKYKRGDATINRDNTNEQYHHLTNDEYLDYMQMASNDPIIFNTRKIGGMSLWIDGDLIVCDLDITDLGPIAGISGNLFIKNSSLTKEVIIEKNINILGNIIDDYFYKTHNCACVTLIEKNIRIIILPTNNENFYNHCILSDQKIDCFFSKRTGGDQFEYIACLSDIQVEEAIIGEYPLEVKTRINYDQIGENFICESTEFEGDRAFLFKLR
jgi:hypothetical protein